MSTRLATSASWYRIGAKYGMDGSLGYDGYPLVGRFRFQTPSTGATELSFASDRYFLYGGDYAYRDDGFQFLVTASSTGYESSTGSGIGSPTSRSGDSLTGNVSVQLMPDRNYYLWIWPRSQCYYRMEPGTITVTVEGVYGTPSTIAVSDGNFGSQIPVSLNVSTEGAIHNLRVECAGQTETLLRQSGAVSCIWTPDLETYAALLPDSPAAEAVFTCETFYGGNSVGTSTASVTLRFAQGSLPPVLTAGWAKASVYNNGTAASGLPVYVQSVSKAEIRFDNSKVACRSGAEIVGYSVRCGGKTIRKSPYRTGVLTGNTDILCSVTDSRGQQASETLHIPVESYTRPVITELAVFRADSTGNADEAGQYYSAKGKAIYSPLAGENSVTLSAAHKLSDAATFGTETTLQNDRASVIGGLSADSSYLVRLTATDALGSSAAVSVALPTQRWAMKFRPSGMGVGFGKAPEHDNCIELPAGWVIRIGDSVVLSE